MESLKRISFRSLILYLKWVFPFIPGTNTKKKNATSIIRVLTFSIFLFPIIRVSAQTYLLNNALDGTTINTCSGTFYDSGGAGLPYSSNENYTVTFCAPAGNIYKFDFTIFSSRPEDVLYIYDGPDKTSALIGIYSGDLPVPFTITSSGSCITFNFISNSDGFVRAGWVASISCFSCSAIITPPITPAGDACAGETKTYSVVNNPGSTYTWTVTGGTPASLIAGPNSIDITWDLPGSFTGIIRVDETSVCGSTSFSELYVDVYPIPTPLISGFSVVCPNASGVVYTTPFVAGNSYLWNVSGGTYTATANTVEVDWGASGTGTVSVTETDLLSGCSVTTPDFLVNINDIVPPVFSGCPVNINVTSPAGLCTATATWIEPTAIDGCEGPMTFTTRSHIPGATFNQGITPVTYTFTDGAGNTSICSFNVTVIETELPVAVCKDITIALDAFGAATITGAQIDNGSTDNCGIASITVAPNAFVIADIGPNPVTLTVTDNSGNISTCTATVTVLGSTIPIALCKDFTAFLNATGSVTISASDIDNGSFDSDGIASWSLDKSTFDCSNIGLNTVTLTVTDIYGNSASCSSVVTVADNVLPTITGPANMTFAADGPGCTKAVTYATPVGSDNCPGSVTTQTLGLPSGSNFPVGITTNTFNVVDASGNSATYSFSITITSSLDITTVSTNSCNTIPGIASRFESVVTGGVGPYTYFWDGLDDPLHPFMFISLFPFSFSTSNTTTVSNPLLNALLPDGNYSVRLTVTDAIGCTDSYVINFTKSGLTSNNISTSSSVACDGETISYSVGFNVNATYAWEVVNGTLLLPANTNVVQVVWDRGTATGVVRTNISQTTGFGTCESSVINNVTINPIPVPSFTSQPGASTCAGTIVNYGTQAGQVNYIWTFSGTAGVDYIINSGGTSSDNTVALRWITPGTRTVTINYSNASGCTGATVATSTPTVVNPAPSVPGVITGTQAQCPSMPGQVYSISAVAGATTYLWTVPLGWSIVSGDGTTSLTVITGLAGNNGNIAVTAVNGCGTSAPSTLPVTVDAGIPAVPGSITGLVAQCPGLAGQVYSVVPVPGATSYIWTLPVGWTGSSTTNSITVTTGAAGGIISVVAENSCGTSAASNLPVTMGSAPSVPGPISGTLVQCPNLGGQMYSVAPVPGATTYIWLLPTGWIGSSTTNTITVTTGLTGDDGNIAVTAGNTCGTSAASILAVSVAAGTPAVPGVITGATPQCAGVTGQVYSVTPIPGATTYSWTLPGGWTGSSTTNSITVSIGASGGNISVAAGNSCGISAPATLAVVVNTTPVAAAGNNGPVCVGSILTLTGPAGMDTYSWTGPLGFIDATQSPTVSASATAGMAGVYTLTVTDNGCTSAPVTTTVVVNAVPTAPAVGAITQPTCATATGSVILNGLPAGNWTINPGAIPGTGASYTVIGLAAATYNFTVTSAAGCVSPASANVVIDPQPATPTAPTLGAITQPTCATATGSVILNGLPAGNWTINPGAIAGTGASYTVTGLAAATYNFTVTSAAGCVSPASANVVIDPQPATPTAPTLGAITQPTCATATGSVILNGLPAGNWTINPGAIAGTGASYTVTGLAAATYNFTVTSAAGCVSPASANVVIDPQPATPTAPTLGAITQPTCATATGSVILNGLPAGNWTINPGAIPGTGASYTVIGLAAATYNFTVTSAAGCVSPASANVVIDPQPATPTAPTLGAITQPTCATATGSVILNGLPAGNWTINPGAIAGTGASYTVIGLAAATYNFTVTSAAGCVSPASANVVIDPQPATPTAPTLGAITQPTCATATGSVVLNGLPAGTWTINPGAISGSGVTYTVTGLPAAATYNFTVASAAGCLSPASADVVINPAPTAPAIPTIASIIQPTCALPTGTIVFTVQAGVDYGIDGIYQASETFPGLTPATYSLSVRSTSDNTCITAAASTETINAVPGAVTGSASVTSAIVCNGGTATVTLVSAGGTAPISYTFNGVTNATGVFAGIPAGLAYAWSITDAGGCAPASGTLDVTEPAIITGSASVTTSILCNGGTATVTLTGAGGTAPLSYTFNGVTNAAGVFAGIPAGLAYAWSITDAGGCAPASGTLDVTEPAIITGSASVTTSILCNGGTATVTLTGAGGTAPLSYTFNGVTNATGVFAGIPAGLAYAWSITDAGGCAPASGTLDVTEPAIITGSASVTTSILCNGGTATVTLTGAGGTAPLSYTFNGVTNATGVFAGIPAGLAYAWSITDAGGCAPASGTLDVTEPAIITGSASVTTSILCNGGTATVTLVSAGGTAPISYTFNGVTNATGVFAGIPAGLAYAWSITDAGGCAPASGTLDVTEPAIITGSASVTTSILCNGGTATVTLTGAGGTAPLSYTFNGVTNATGVFAGIPAGLAYAWSITDAGGCAPASGTLDVTEPAIITGSASVTTSILCNGGTATVTLTGAGGTAPLSYTFNGVTNAAGVFAGIPAGLAYAWSITDAGGCAPASGTLDVTEPAIITGSASVTTSILCNGGTATVTLTGAGGTAPLSYTFNGVTNAAGVFAGIPAGLAYAWSITDAGGCAPASGTLDVTEPAIITGSASVTTSILCNGGTATVTLTGAGGTAPLSYTFNGVTNATGIFAGIPAGLAYAWSITDAGGCAPASGTLDVTEPVILSGVIVSQTNVLTFGGNTGSVEVAGAGGTGTYQYSLDGGPYQASGIFGSLAAGSYTITVRDINLCTASVLVDITQPAELLSGSITAQTNITCFGTATGSVTVQGSGGVTPYEYQIDAGTWQLSGTFGSLILGNYIVTVRDAASDTFDVPVTITSPSATVGGSIISQVNVLCFGSNTGDVTVAGTGGITPYMYNIDGGTYQSSAYFSSLSAGTHIVTVQDINLCSFNIDVVITEPGTLLSASITAQTNVSCSGLADGTITSTGTGGTGPIEYSINGGAFQPSGIFAGLAPGTYNVTVRDANLCTAVLPPADITEPSALALSASSTETLCPGEPGGTITMSISGGTQPYSVIWSDGITTTNRIDIPNGTYSVVVTDLNGCAASTDVEVGFTGSETCLEVLEIITPNNDGFNDTWKIKNIDLFPNAQIFVYNRWGKEVFSSRNLSSDEWDGTFNGKALPTDSYHYILHLNNGSPTRSGVISIIR